MLAMSCCVALPMNATVGCKAGRNLFAGICSCGWRMVAKDSALWHAVFATMQLAVVTALALQIRNAAFVLGLVGGSLTTIQMFWMPAFIYWRLMYNVQGIIFRRVVFSCLCLGG